MFLYGTVDYQPSAKVQSIDSAIKAELGTSQLKHIQSVVCELNEELDVVKNNAAGKMKAYIVTGISAGLILVIVLI